MFFKSMEIYGFKSFPDKTILNFDRKMTAVVGSNGNGKSNISDALRWVMGEQGAKSLRGDKMEDVIFHGTVRRKAMGFAKVTLTIDNSDGALRGMGDEVVISRKLYRSGESEYKINGAKALLKNINELLMGTGLGKDGYSVIGQGKVSEIVEAGGSKRREVFEEAAGVSKFLAQKKDAENRLKRAEENLLRIRDIASELEQRLPVLEKQAAKAKKAKALLEEEEKLDISVSVYELDILEKTESEAEDKLLLNKAECENLDRDIERAEQKQEEQNEIKLQLRAESDRLRSEGDNARERASEIRAEIAVKQNDISHAESEKLRLQGVIREGKSGKERLIAEKQKLYGLKEQKRDDISAAKEKIHELTERLTGIGSQSQSLSDEYKKLDEAQGKLYFSLTRIKLQLDQISGSDEENKRRIEQITADIEKSEEEIKNQKAAIRKIEDELENANEQKSEAENKLVGYRKLYSGKSERLKASQQEIEKLQKQYDADRSRYDVLDGIDKSMAGFTASVKSIIGAKRKGMLSGIHGTVADIISVDKRYTVAVETALGAAMQNIVTDNEDIAKRGIRYLKENNLGRATFLPITSVRGSLLQVNGVENEEGFEGIASELTEYNSRYDGIVKSLLGRTVITEDIDSGSVIAKKYGYKFRIVTLDGQVINAGGSFTGGSVRTDAGIISRKQELSDLEEKTRKLSDKLKAANEQLKPLTAEVAKMSIEMEGFAETADAAKLNIARLEAELSGAEKLLRELKNRRDSNEDLLESVHESADLSKQQALKLDGERQQTEALIEENRIVLEQQAKELSASDHDKQQIADSISALNLDILNAEHDIESIDIRIDTAEQSLKAIDDNGSEYLEQISQQDILIKTLGEDIEGLKQAARDIELNATDSEKKINQNIEKTNNAEKIINELHRTIRDLTEAKEKFSAEYARQEERKNSATAQTEKIISGLWDRYEITRSEAKQRAQELENPSEAKFKLSEIKRSIASLGNVNYSSIDELAELSERYGVLSVQLKDVEGSKAELTKLISDLTADIKRRFNESFNEINHHFGILFSEIFSGGEARLQLSNPEDVLNSDVEIYAAPPGKVIKNLSLLSGGEKSMVALTIYLAILLHRPTPFCMLDEVDAALDETNVQKYATYLKRFSDKTQLMIITHRRGTIELCDVLYGVYMQEKGVSRLIRQEITDDLDLED